MLAVIADIHGNSAALAAVLRDMDRLGVSQAVNLGDHFSGPLDAAGTADLLISRDFLTIRGNHDRWLVEVDPVSMGLSDRAAFEQLGSDHLDWLRQLPATLTRDNDILLCHGTPDSDVTYWLERVENDGRVRQANHAEIKQHLPDSDASLILCAHTHIPRVVRTFCGRTILNPGSVGCPAYDDDRPVYHQMSTGTPNASYAIVERTDDGWSATFRSVPYNWQKMAQMAHDAGRLEWAQGLSTGWLAG